MVESERQYGEALRPQFHFTAEKNWLNDPNGLVYYRGTYHLFFQHNPIGIDWGNMSWGHAVSPDLVHWRQLGNALEPDAMGTMFSGSAIVDWRNTAGLKAGETDTVVVLYTAAGGSSPESEGEPFTQCLAYSNDGGLTLTKFAGNPVLGEVRRDNRDPKVTWHEPTQSWVMALYLDKHDFALFSSPDLITWSHLQDIEIPGCTECPDLFEIGLDGDAENTRCVLTAANGKYLVGDFDGQTFVPECEPQTVDFGKNYYAVQTYSDLPDARRVQVAWMASGVYPGMPFNQQMSFPCELTLHTDAASGEPRLRRWPVAEISGLYDGLYSCECFTLVPSSANPLVGVEGDLFDISVEVELGQATAWGLRVRGEVIEYSVAAQALSCLGCSAKLPPVCRRVSLRVLVDRTSLEVFGNGGQASMTSCFLPAGEERGLELYTEGGSIRVISLVVHELRSAWDMPMGRG